MRFARAIPLGPLALAVLVPLLAGAAVGATGWPAVPPRLALDTSAMAVQNGRAVMYLNDTITLKVVAYDTRGRRVTGPKVRWETILVPKGQPFAGKPSAGRFIAAGKLYGAQFGFVYGRVMWLRTDGTITVPFTFPILTRTTGPNAVASMSLTFPMEPGTAGIETGYVPRFHLWSIYGTDSTGAAVAPPYVCQQLIPGEPGDSPEFKGDTLVVMRANSGQVPPGWGKAPVWCVPAKVAVRALDATGKLVMYYPAVEG